SGPALGCETRNRHRVATLDGVELQSYRSAKARVRIRVRTCVAALTPRRNDRSCVVSLNAAWGTIGAPGTNVVVDGLRERDSLLDSFSRDHDLFLECERAPGVELQSASKRVLTITGNRVILVLTVAQVR